MESSDVLMFNSFYAASLAPRLVEFQRKNSMREYGGVPETILFPLSLRDNDCTEMSSSSEVARRTQALSAIASIANTYLQSKFRFSSECFLRDYFGFNTFEDGSIR